MNKIYRMTEDLLRIRGRYEKSENLVRIRNLKKQAMRIVPLKEEVIKNLEHSIDSKCFI